MAKNDTTIDRSILLDGMPEQASGLFAAAIEAIAAGERDAWQGIPQAVKLACGALVFQGHGGPLAYLLDYVLKSSKFKSSARKLALALMGEVSADGDRLTYEPCGGLGRIAIAPHIRAYTLTDEARAAAKARFSSNVAALRLQRRNCGPQAAAIDRMLKRAPQAKAPATWEAILAYLDKTATTAADVGRLMRLREYAKTL